MSSSSIISNLSLTGVWTYFGGQADYGILALVSFLAALGVTLWLRRPGRAGDGHLSSSSLMVMWGVLLAILIPGWFMVDAAGHRENQRLRAMIEGFAPTYAEELTAMGHASIKLDTPPDDPLYLAMIAKQIRWLKLNPSVADIYTFRRDPKGNALIVDSETDYDHDGRFAGERESRTRIGEVWEEFSDQIDAAYAGFPGFDSEPYTDRWGTWVSAYMPMRDEQGRVEAVLGVDYPAQGWVDAIGRARLSLIAFVGFLATVCLSAAAIITVLRANLVDRRRAELALREAKEATDRANQSLARSNRELKQFAYVASHDLQEPLRMVTSFLQLLQKRSGEELGVDAREYIKHAVDGADRMRRLINGLLKLSQVERKGRPPDSVDSGAALEVALDNLGVAIEESGAVIARGDLPRVMVDETQLIQLFQNLVGNAIKFCPEKAPHISISAGSGRHDGWVGFSIADDGPGIPPEHRERVFQIFQRLHPAKEIEGTGIGLTLCQRIVEHHGGTIRVEEAPEGGALFRFTLPKAGW